jgi:PAS domain S-box-containing protein
VNELSTRAFEVLRKDEDFILYRGWSQSDGGRILVLSPVAEHPTPECLKRLEHECSFKEALDPAWSARPIAVARDSNRMVLASEDPGGVPLDQLLAIPLELGLFLRLAVSLSSAIDQLHERGIIHKDIKPANVLVDPVTGRCWLRGFGIASRLPRERQAAEPPEFLAGTLAYMAPEQTGRMNRCVDCRSDLYALGATLYEVLTGSLPFTASDPMEWIHCHVARKPVAPSEQFETIPLPISAIIMKLLAKTAEERYQTADGVKHDLQRCLDALGTISRSSDSTELAEVLSNAILEFPLGEHDTPDRLLIPEKLYGRAGEIDTLLASFDRVVTSGVPELVLVSGYSGVGKSSVVNELHKALAPARGFFAWGKFDQYKREIPYSTLAQAFQGLVRLLLGKSDAELNQWRDALRQALDPNGQLIVDLVPELALILGEQPPVPELPARDAQRRFQLVLRRFISVFAQPEHPLALFLDDLQWLDTATLDLLEDLLRQPDVQHLMLIGAYRDNEVSASHLLVRKLEEIRQAGAIVSEIVLSPLSCEDLGQLIADSLHCEPVQAAPLAQLVHHRTAGNPFFAGQFIAALTDEEFLRFDHASGSWTWDLQGIHAKGYTDNVVDLMLGKLNRLPVESQKALKTLACLGNSAEITKLSIVHGTSEEQLHSDLWEALRLEFVVRLEGSYKFVHDRVQEAAYSLIPEELRAAAHLQIGRRLSACTPPERRTETIFEIVSQLNRGASLVDSRDEREQLAEFNLLAGKRAKASTAYTSALKYFVAGAAFSAGDSWERRPELIFALESHRAECEFLTGDLAAAEQRLMMLSSHAANTIDRATVECLRMDLYTTLDQPDRAVAACLDYLRHLGVEWSPHPTEEDARREYEQIWLRLGSRTIEELIDLPLMSDPVSLATLDVLTKVFPPALHATDTNLLSLTVCRAVNLSLERGHGDGSCVAYVFFGKIAGPYFGDYEAGYRFGQLGYDLVEKRGLERFQARTYHWFSQFVAPWKKHVRACRNLVRRTFEAATKVGDLTVAAYSCDNLNTNLLAAGDSLGQAQHQAENGLEFSRKARFSRVGDVITTQLRLILTLRGLTPKLGSFNDGQFDESRFERHLASSPETLPECWYWIRKLQARFFAGDYAAAIDASIQAKRLLWTSFSFFEWAEYHFYSALARAAVSDSAVVTAKEDLSDEALAKSEVGLGLTKEEHFNALLEHHKQLALWAENCPENFENRAVLVSAEIARLAGRDLDAMRLYEQAIHSSDTNGFVHNEALANELAARFYLVRGLDKIAYGYLRDARHCYLGWGATGKVQQLDELYPRLREQALVPGPAPFGHSRLNDLAPSVFAAGGGSTIDASVEHLDLATVIKVAQTVSSEMVLEKLINTLMRTAIEHAGAERGLLILPRDVGQSIEAEAITSGDTVIVKLREAPGRSGTMENVGPSRAEAGALSAETELPESIIHYVVRSQESVILDDAASQNPFSGDPYLRRHHARSILCLPLINQAKLIGVLYLENNLTPHVFTPTRIAVLRLLASQAAISLENTRLYRDLEKREAKIRRLVDANIMGMFSGKFDGRIIEANEAFLRLVNYNREDLVSGRLNWKELTPPEWRDLTERALEQLKATGVLQPYEKEYFRKDGSRVPVLVGSAVFEEGQNEGVSFVLDLSEKKRAEDALRRSQAHLAEAQAELAHVTRVTALGELTASIAHEISQPLAAVVTNADASLRWLSGDSPDLDEARAAIRRISRDGRRAGDVISRMRSLFKKAGPAKDQLNLNEAIEEVVTLTEIEARRTKVALRTELAADLPPITGDRVQLQQVVVNLILNAIEAMAMVKDRERELVIRTELSEGDEIRVVIRDSGIGIDPLSAERIFDAFHTTKPGGLGMGLSISRSIVENHGGRLWAISNDGPGATFQFTLLRSASVPGQHPA